MNTPADLGALWQQVAWRLILPIPIASVSWTITHEEIFREIREYCVDRSRTRRRLLERKCFYVLTCEQIDAVQEQIANAHDEPADPR